MRPAELIAEARASAGLTQAELARRASTSQPAVARYEAGTTSPSVTTLERLLRACGRELQLGSRTAPPADLSGPLGRLLRSRRADVFRVARAHGARRVRVFGSVARGNESPQSDIDLLVDLDPGRTLVDLAALTRVLHDILGVPVDVSTEDLLRPAIRRAALREAVPV